MGTFAITQFTNVVSLSGRATGPGFVDPGWYGYWYDGSNHSGSADLDILEGTNAALQVANPGSGFTACNSTLGTPGHIVFGFNQTDAIFVLDGNAAVNYAALPAGLNVTNLSIHWATTGVQVGQTVTATMNGQTASYPLYNATVQTVTIPLVVSPTTIAASALVALTLTLAATTVNGTFDIEDPGFVITGTYSTGPIIPTTTTGVTPAVGSTSGGD